MLKTLIACQPEPRDAPAGDVPEAERSAGFYDAHKRRATSVSGAQDTAHAGSRDVRNGDAVLLQDLQNAKVRESARETSAKSEADACPPGHGGGPFFPPLSPRGPHPPPPP